MTSRAPLIALAVRRAAAGHSRDEITAAAVAIADREGLDAVSMRRVAARLGTGAASLYRYLKSREDLLDIGEQARAIMRRHPWLPPLLTTRPVLGPNGLVILEHVLEALAPHPASSAAKLETLGLLNAATALFVQNELADGPDRQQRNAAYLRCALPPATARAWLNCSPRRHHLPAPALRGAASHPADRYRDILARILSGLLPHHRTQARGAPTSGCLRQ